MSASKLLCLSCHFNFLQLFTFGTLKVFEKFSGKQSCKKRRFVLIWKKNNQNVLMVYFLNIGPMCRKERFLLIQCVSVSCGLSTTTVRGAKSLVLIETGRPNSASNFVFCESESADNLPTCRCLVKTARNTH